MLFPGTTFSPLSGSHCTKLCTGYFGCIRTSTTCRCSHYNPDFSIIFSNAVLPELWLNTAAILVSQSACKQWQAVLHQHLSTYLMEHEAYHSQKTWDSCLEWLFAVFLWQKSVDWKSCCIYPFGYCQKWNNSLLLCDSVHHQKIIPLCFRAQTPLLLWLVPLGKGQKMILYSNSQD